MKILSTTVSRLAPTEFRVVMTLADKEPIEDAGETIALTVVASTEDDNPFLRELQGVALDRVLAELQQQRQALKVWRHPSS